MEHDIHALLAAAQDGQGLDDGAARSLADVEELAPLLAAAAALRDAGRRNLVSYSRKVFIPLTQLCRDVCHYCTFAHPPRAGQRAYMTREEVLAVARAGAAAGCKEALFTLGDKPELRYRQAAEELAALGHPTTISYLAEVCALVLRETGLLPHANPGVMTADEIAALRAAGGELVVMPHADTSLIRAAKAEGLLCVPGVATPTEALAARAAGADALKLFPAEALPPPVLKAWRAVLPPRLRVLPVGGVTPASLATWRAAGAGGAGLGSALYSPGFEAAEVGVRARAFAAAWRGEGHQP